MEHLCLAGNWTLHFACCRCFMGMGWGMGGEGIGAMSTSWSPVAAACERLGSGGLGRRPLGRRDGGGLGEGSGLQLEQLGKLIVQLPSAQLHNLNRIPLPNGRKIASITPIDVGKQSGTWQPRAVGHRLASLPTRSPRHRASSSR
eukprot:scaffold72791_cov26-Tisochrysis_lutea.AAC.6